MAKKEENKEEKGYVPEFTKYDDISSHSSHIYPFDCAPLDLTVTPIHSGKIYEFWALESQGKTTLSLEIAKAFTAYWDSLKQPCQLVFIETESAFDLVRGALIGVDIKRCKLNQAETVEEGFAKIMDILKTIEQKKAKAMIIWDTLSAAPTADALAGNKEAMMAKPKKIREYLRQITIQLGKTDSTLIFINQAQVGGEGVPEVAGSIGGGIKFHASVRCYLKKVESIVKILGNGKEFEKAIITEIRNVKNKLGTPRQRARIVIDNERGVDKADTLVRNLVEFSTNMKDNRPIEISGSWKTMKIPKAAATKPTDDIEFETLTAQQFDKLTDMIRNNKLGYDWCNYLCYTFYINESPLLKIRELERIWAYEMTFFGKRKTKLTEEEKTLAQIIYDKEMLRDKEEEDRLKKEVEDRKVKSEDEAVRGLL